MTDTRSDSKTGPILVIGGTGKTGRRIAERLAARGIPVRIGSRSGHPAFDWEEPGTWEAALAGASAAYVSFYPDLALPGAAELVEALARRAGKLGVHRLVLLSGRGEAGAEHAERLLQAATADWTILRADWFAQNFSESFALDAILGGEVALPAGDVAEPFVDAEDIADVAVAALTEAGHSGRLYELSGPRAMTFADAVAEIARATGRSITYRQVPLPDFIAGLRDQGLPAPMLALMRILFEEVLDGRNTAVRDGVRQALGRPPADFADYVARTAASGAWRS